MSKTILVFPSTQRLDNNVNPKEYPYFKELIDILISEGNMVIQIGKDKREKICPTFIEDLSFNDLKLILNRCDYWISVDTFIQHLVKTENINKRGVVLWGPSDPKYFGYEENLNIFKDSKNFRERQYMWWRGISPDYKIWLNPKEVLNIIKSNGF